MLNMLAQCIIFIFVSSNALADRNIVVFGGNLPGCTPQTPYAQLINPIVQPQPTIVAGSPPNPYASCCVPATTYNNKIYVIGGSTSTGTILTNVYSFTLTGNTLSNAVAEPSMNQARAMHSSVVLNNLLYVCGGLLNTNTDISTCETLAVSNCGSGRCTTTWTSTTAMPSNRWDHVAVVLNSKMYIIGGSVFQGSNLVYLETMISFDPRTNTWSNEASMSTKRKGLGAVVSQGKIVVCGGTSDGTTSLSSCESYDPTTRSWTQSATLQIPRVDHRMVLYNGLIVVIGGQTSSTTATDSIEVFYPQFPYTAIVSKKINGAREVFAAASI